MHIVAYKTRKTPNGIMDGFFLKGKPRTTPNARPDITILKDGCFKNPSKKVIKLSLRFSFFCVFFVSKGNILDFYST